MAKRLSPVKMLRAVGKGHEPQDRRMLDKREGHSRFWKMQAWSFRGVRFGGREVIFSRVPKIKYPSGAKLAVTLC